MAMAIKVNSKIFLPKEKKLNAQYFAILQISTDTVRNQLQYKTFRDVGANCLRCQSGRQPGLVSCSLAADKH